MLSFTVDFLADRYCIFILVVLQLCAGMFGDKKNTSGDNSKPAFQFGGNVIFGDKKNTSGDSSKPPFQFGANNGIFGDKKNTPGDSSKPTFQFGVNNGFLASSAASLFSTSAAQSFSSQSPPLFSMNQQSVLSGTFLILNEIAPPVLFISHIQGLNASDINIFMYSRNALVSVWCLSRSLLQCHRDVYPHGSSFFYIYFVYVVRFLSILAVRV